MFNTKILIICCLSTVALCLAFVGCGEGDSGSYTNSSGQTCEYDYSCENGSCECTNSGREGTSCCDPDDCGSDDSNACPGVCEVCS
jgi:hypothetical protein